MSVTTIYKVTIREKILFLKCNCWKWKIKIEIKVSEEYIKEPRPVFSLLFIVTYSHYTVNC